MPIWYVHLKFISPSVQFKDPCIKFFSWIANIWLADLVLVTQFSFCQWLLYSCNLHFLHIVLFFHYQMLQSASEFTTAVQALFATQEQSITANSLASGDHLCFVGSGREQEDQYTFMVVAHFLQRHSQYVSICRGGYIGESGSLLLFIHDACYSQHSPARGSGECCELSQQGMGSTRRWYISEQMKSVLKCFKRLTFKMPRI